MQRIPRICLIVNRNREKLYTAVSIPEFCAANFVLCGWYVLKLGPGFHCSNGSTLSRTISVGFCVVMTLMDQQNRESPIVLYVRGIAVQRKIDTVVVQTSGRSHRAGGRKFGGNGWFVKTANLAFTLHN